MLARYLVGSLLFLVLGAVPALALDLEGKWGLGVGAGGILGTVPDVSVLRGRAANSAWLVTVRLAGTSQDGETTITGNPFITPTGSNNSNNVSVTVAPGLRHFTRPVADFSPYYDLFLSTNYDRNHAYVDGDMFFQRAEQSEWGVGAGLALGVEWFSPWHFSLAAHSGIASVNWKTLHERHESPMNSFEQESSVFWSGFSVSPILALRVYF